MSIETTIRRLRREHNMTQERLAEILSISPQAVSRWETGAAMPDISLIAPLCNIFSITSDELLEIDIQNRQAKIDEYANEYCKFASAVQKTEELRQYTIRKLREGLRMFPEAKLLKQQLTTVLWLNIEKPSDPEEKIDQGTFVIKSVFIRHISEIHHPGDVFVNRSIDPGFTVSPDTVGVLKSNNQSKDGQIYKNSAFLQ